MPDPGARPDPAGPAPHEGPERHDSKRHGTTILFAALNVLEGKVIGTCYPRHRHGEFRKFLQALDRDTPAALHLHLIVDNYGTHAHPNVQRWLAEHPRFHLHLTPTSSSWLNLVDRWFRDLTTNRIRRGVFLSVPDLVAATNEYIQVRSEQPKPFVWAASAEMILTKVGKCKAILGRYSRREVHAPCHALAGGRSCVRWPQVRGSCEGERLFLGELAQGRATR